LVNIDRMYTIILKRPLFIVLSMCSPTTEVNEGDGGNSEVKILKVTMILPNTEQRTGISIEAMYHHDADRYVWPEPVSDDDMRMACSHELQSSFAR
jgi:hypothetical protein